MYIIKRTDIIFESNGNKIKSSIEELKLNKVIDIENRETKKYRVIKGKDYYEVEENEWNKIKSIYSEIVEKDIIETTSYEIPTKESSTYCYINEDDYCSLVRKLKLSDYREEKEIEYSYFVETKSLISKVDMEFEIEKEVYELIKNMNN